MLLKPGITSLSREKQDKFHREPASLKYANEEDILALQEDPRTQNSTPSALCPPLTFAALSD